MMKKQWWLAIGAVAAGLYGLNAVAQNAGPERAGVAAAVNPSASGQLAGGGPSKVVVVASDVYRDEHIITDAGGQVHLLFLDESALTVGPNSEVILDKFVYDPQSNTGTLALTAVRGSMRFIGGKLSKVNPIEIHTQTATIGVRGGSVMVKGVAEPTTQVIFLVGREATVSDTSGNLVATLTKTGTEIDIEGNKFSLPFAVSVAQLRAALVLLQGQPKGAPGMVTPGTQTVTDNNSAKTPQQTTAQHIIQALELVTLLNVQYYNNTFLGSSNVPKLKGLDQQSFAGTGTGG